MSRLEELIQKYCPDGVEYLALWKITSWDKQFNSVKKEKQPTKENFKHVSSKIIKELKCNGNVILLSTGMFEGTTTLEKAQNYLNEGEVIAIPSGGNATVKYNKGKFVDSGNLLASTNQNTKYVYYCLLNNLEFIQNCYRGSGIKHPDMSKILELEIPVPPLPVQQEIVRILDSFTTLTAELEARKKLYEFFRDELLETAGNGNIVRFGDIANIVRGASPRPIRNYVTTNQDGVNWIKIGDIQIGTKYVTETAEKITAEGAKKSRFVHPGDFILSNSMSFGRPYIVQIDGCIHDGWLSISGFNDVVTTDYLYHLLNSNVVQQQMKKKASFGGAVQNLNADIVKSLELKIPKIKEQEKIVSVLDCFDTLCNDISSGLPAEIKARQKQYEYYRDKLLTFKRLGGDE